MSLTNTISIADSEIPITTSQTSIDIPAVLRFKPFVEWVSAISKETFRKKELEIRQVEIQNVDYFGPKIGFIKFKVDARLTENGKNVPGIVFMRGGSVAVLLVLRSKENNDGVLSEHVVLTSQPRIPVASLAFPEIPAGMLDGSGNFVGKASEEIMEETGIQIKEHDLVDMTELAYGDKYRGVYPSPEAHASAVAEDLNVMLKNLQSQMFEASKLTCASFDIYDQTVTNYGAAIEAAMSKARELIDKCDAVDKEFANVQTLASQIKSIRQQVDALQHAIR